MTNTADTRAKGIRLRMGVVCACLASCLGLVVSGAYQIQIADGDAWRSLAERQRQRRLHLSPKRGAVDDRNGAALAESVDVPSVSIDAVETLRHIPADALEPAIASLSARIGDALSLPREEVAEKLRRRKRFAWLKRRVSEAEVAAVRALGDPKERNPVRGLTIDPEGQRFYPNRELASTLLGFVSPDGEGREGVELSLDHELRGRVSEVRGLRDRSGKIIFSEGLDDESALAGHDLFLTIDKGIQYTAERELEAAVKTYEALGGSVVVVDPSTGEVLAMASAPTFNPNDYSKADPDTRRNRAVTDRFEPGSTMKAFTMATALAHRSIDPTAPIFCEEGSMPIDNVVLHDTHVHRWLSPTQVLAYSSNIGTAKIALGLGESKLYEGLRRFGFGELTGVPLTGESPGILRPRNRAWVQVETASAAFGQGIGVTNLQLAMAMSAIANGGRLLEPQVVRKVRDGTGATLSEVTPRLRREVVPPRIARMVADMLVAVTEGEGTGVEAAIPGFRVAGKTATAQKIDLSTGRYTDTLYVASFVGFVPADKPRLVISVVIDEPMGGAYAGGSVAAPVFRRVGEMALRHLGILPKDTERSSFASVAEQAKGSDVATKTYAALGVARADADKAPVLVAGPPPRAGQARVPDVTGLPMRAAVQALVEAGLEAEVSGTGRATKQSHAAGTVVPKSTRVQLTFEPAT